MIRKQLKGIVLAILLFSPKLLHAEQLIIPPENIKKIVKQLEYSDFPKALDILAIIRVESQFKANALNKEDNKRNPNRRVKPSRGLMQVQGGSFDVNTNLHQGIGRLRDYYLLCHHSKKCAIESYNIGPRNYSQHRYLVSGEEYWAKYLQRKSEYLSYYHGKNVL